MSEVYEYTNLGIIISSKMPKATGNQIFDYYNIPGCYHYWSKGISSNECQSLPLPLFQDIRYRKST